MEEKKPYLIYIYIIYIGKLKNTKKNNKIALTEIKLFN